ncbi:hypothetical protein PVK06_008992 [Gossypium arboreum]|uniref:Uncharacterized protein n=1 Tax=Gossypium arboreum TaxID=29729 RepID=A0ABR0QLB7_GOSAR|nr:hypothetical protein PVK06_008992 [Gossypium arboreum]
MLRHTRSCVTTLKAVCFIFKVSSGVCREILRLCHNIEGSLAHYVVTSSFLCCNTVTNIELGRLSMVSYKLTKYISSSLGLIRPLSVQETIRGLTNSILVTVLQHGKFDVATYGVECKNLETTFSVATQPLYVAAHP